MKNSIFLLLVAACFLVTNTALLADEFPGAVRGKVAILTNERTLEGDIELIGSKYRIRREVGELWVNSERVRTVCASWADAVKYMESRANLRDPDERLRLAQWCYQNHLYDQAIQEAKIAVQLRPDHRLTMQFLATLERSKKIANRHLENDFEPEEPKEFVSLDLNADSMRDFSSRVQPILMNTCVRCHSGTYEGSFYLQRTHGTGSRSRRATLQNLSTVLAHVNIESLELSPLLIKSVSLHGYTDKPPLPSRQSKPYVVLTNWLEQTVKTNPHLKQKAIGLARAEKTVPEKSTELFATVTPDQQNYVNTVPVASSPEPRLLPSLGNVEALTKENSSPGFTDDPAIQQAINKVPMPNDPRVTQSPLPSTTLDEYDPQVFNRQMHPQQQSKQK